MGPPYDEVMKQDMTMGETGVGSSFLRFFRAVAGDCEGKGRPFQQLVCESLERENLEDFPSAVPVDGTVSFTYSFIANDGGPERPGIPVNDETAR